MNAQLNTFLTALAAVAASAVLALTLAEATDAAQPQNVQATVKLERVVIVGKAVSGAAAPVVMAQRIEKLPRVVITGRHAEPDTQVAMAQPACTVQAAC